MALKKLALSLALALSPGLAHAVALTLPDCSVAAKAETGAAVGTLTAKDGLAAITAEVSGFGDYVENWRMPAAVLDFRLPQAVPVPVNCGRVTMLIDCPYMKSPKSAAMLRALIRDRRGAEWAVGTRLQGGSSRIPFTKGFDRIETYGWGVNELGRVDPWVMTSLDPVKYDEYCHPELPVSVVGIRLIVTEGNHFEMALKGLAGELEGVPPDPYWCFSSDPTYAGRYGAEGEIDTFGWGPDESGPRLRASDLDLSPGRFAFTWEILGADESKSLRSGSGVLDAKLPANAIELPLLPCGSYRLRLFLRPEGAGVGKLRHLLLMVIRNSRPEPVAAVSPTKPLRLDSEGAFHCSAPGTLTWTVESPDRRPLRQGEAQVAAGSRTTPDLHDLMAKETALWLTARLVADGVELDAVDRVLAKPSTPPPPPSALGGKAAKLAPLLNVFRRTKGDWHEGNTSIVGRHAETMENMKGWLDEAKETGYNIVEFSAPWYDLEPLPGAYQFEYLDRLVAEAKKRGLYVVLRSHPIATQVPGWVPRELQEDQSFRVHGVWHGGSNLIFTPASQALRSNYYKFLEALATHYRGDANVLGYILTNVFFDHGFIDGPWLGEHVDCSNAMRLRYVDFLKAKYGTLAALAVAHQRSYGSWEDVAIPSFEPELDPQGRVRPPSTAPALDYADCKRQVMLTFRTDAFAALRQGDPACILGPYSDSTRVFLERTFVKESCFVPQGAMEDQYIPAVSPYIVRFEPHAKVSRGALTTDVGLSNLAFHKLGWSELFNYWMPEWRLATVTPDIRAAELRLKAWFKALDTMNGAVELQQDDGLLKPAARLASLETLFYAWRHVHGSRLDDYLNLHATRANAEKLRCDTQFTPAVTPATLKDCPYVYVPYASDTLDSGLVKTLSDYVEAGGHLAMEWSGGYWSPRSERRNVLGSALGLPDTKPVDRATDAVAATLVPGGPFDGVKLAFRTRGYKPPTDDQPVPWIHTAARPYFRLCEFVGPLPAGAKVLANVDGSPAVITLKRGKGEVMLFAGTVDWLACPGLASRLDAWGRGLKSNAQQQPDPELLVSSYTRGDERFALGRRFASHSLIRGLKQGVVPDGCKEPAELPIPLNGVPGVKYAVTELLSGRDLGQFDGKDAVPLKLVRAEAFVLQAKPQK